MINHECIDTIGSRDRLLTRRITWAAWLKTGVRLLADDFLGLIDVLVTWQRRARDRRQLGQMTDCHLKDIGIDRSRIETECRKPFWRA